MKLFSIALLGSLVIGSLAASSIETPEIEKRDLSTVIEDQETREVQFEDSDLFEREDMELIEREPFFLKALKIGFRAGKMIANHIRNRKRKRDLEDVDPEEIFSRMIEEHFSELMTRDLDEYDLDARFDFDDMEEENFTRDYDELD
ncbi:hypothetical protein FA15DRAFT_668633 [Coprinopsis marcescibilis]|uniref:Uncharacterized protein n=1 Tax=Coprinopsis marcescibilis TaxID=230819 RepID=A0A5C3KYJ9_COPMA|nr:hypothetical protein FA15DRAFT_668633 [Coprinopsis marcescibilis]